MKIATILHYSTNEYRFLKGLVDECSIFSDQVLVPFSDCFFDGKKENRFLLEKGMEENPGALFIGFAFDVKQLYTPFVRAKPMEEEWLCCWHGTARYVGSFFVKDEIDWLFFLDADEIVEGDRFREWIEKEPDLEEKAFWFSSYMYGGQAFQRKKEWQLTGLLMRKNALHAQRILNPQERAGMFLEIIGKKRMHCCGIDGKPMFHHYSWVRTEEERAHKANTWSKKWQKDWMAVKHEEGEFEFVIPYFDPFAVQIPQGTPIYQMMPNEKYVTRRQILEWEYHEIL